MLRMRDDEAFVGFWGTEYGMVSGLLEGKRVGIGVHICPVITIQALHSKFFGIAISSIINYISHIPLVRPLELC